MSGTRHAVLAQQAEARIELGILRGQHAAIADGDHLARMKREAGDIARRLADLLARIRRTGSPTPKAQAASSTTCSPWAPRDRHDRIQVAGHADLVHAEDGARPRGDRRRDQRGIHVVADRLDVDEDRRRAAMADDVGAWR